MKNSFKCVRSQLYKFAKGMRRQGQAYKNKSNTVSANYVTSWLNWWPALEKKNSTRKGVYADLTLSGWRL